MSTHDPSSPDELAIRARIEAAEEDRQRAAALMDDAMRQPSFMAGLRMGPGAPDIEHLRALETDAIARRDAAIADLADWERRHPPLA